MLKRTEKKKHENQEQGKTQHETPRSKNHKATQNKNYTRYRPRTVGSINYRGVSVKALLLSTNLHPGSQCKQLKVRLAE